MKKSLHARRRLITWSIIFAGALSAEVATNAAEAPRAPITLKIVGSSVKNSQGEYLGRIQDIIINPDTGHSEFAMLLLNYPKNTTRVTPIPWALLSYVSDQGQTGGTPGAEQVFELNIDRERLVYAPVLDKSQWSLIAQPAWRQQIYAFYGMLAASAPPAASAISEPNPPPLVESVPEPAAPVFVNAPYTVSYTTVGYLYDTHPGPWRYPCYPDYPWYGKNTQLAGWPSVWPGGTPVIPNGPDMFSASTNYFPGAPAKLPAPPAPVAPATRLVPLKPGAPWSPLVPQQVRPQRTGGGYPVVNQRPPPQRVAMQGSRTFAPALPGPMPARRAMTVRTSTSLAPLAPLAPLGR